MAANSFYSIFSVSSFLFTHDAAPVTFCWDFFIHECTFFKLFDFFGWKPQLHLYRFLPQLFLLYNVPIFLNCMMWSLMAWPVYQLRFLNAVKPFFKLMFIFLRNSPCKNIYIFLLHWNRQQYILFPSYVNLLL